VCVVIAVAVVMLRNFGPYKVIFTNVRVLITVAIVILLRDLGLYEPISVNYVVIAGNMVILLRDFGPSEIIFMTVFTTLGFPLIPHC
jgi:hypothetical protein